MDKRISRTVSSEGKKKIESLQTTILTQPSTTTGVCNPQSGNLMS